jgi:hypothetical protein
MTSQEMFDSITRRTCSYEALDYVIRTMRIYRSAVLTSRKRGYDKPHHASLPEYRKNFIEAYLGYKRIYFLASGV